MNIVLIGPRCSGKTTVGRLLAEKTGKVFQDTDTLVETMAGTPIADLVSARGWEIFRVLEKEAVAAVAAKDRQVIATGGGAVEDPDNARNLAERSFVVWLDGRSNVLKGRLKEEQRSGKIRPSLTGEDPQKEMRRIMETRKGQYERVSSLRVDTSDRTAGEVVEKILDALERKGGRSHGR